jgi:hypothetical protein
LPKKSPTHVVGDFLLSEAVSLNHAAIMSIEVLAVLT